MFEAEKIREKILSGNSDANIDFSDLRWLLAHLGFDERIKSSHHIFTKNVVEEILKLQPRGSKSKSYQVRQVRQVILKYKFGVEDE